MTESGVLPKPRMSVDAFGGTHQGRVRPINEDRFLSRSDLGIWLVADGMGGHSHGDIASSAIVQAVGDEFERQSREPPLERFSTAIHKAHDSIQATSAANGNLTIGSTVAALMLQGQKFFVAWSGDSRAYLIRKGRIAQVTKDHTEAQMLLRQGAISAQEAESWPRKNVILHAVGVHDTPYVEGTEGKLEANDIFVLCTDGLTTHVKDDEIQILTAGNSAKQGCVELVRVALERGGRDNVSVVVVHVGSSAG